MYPCEIIHEGVVWHSAEQLFWYRVAKYNEDEDMARKILLSTDGYEAKKMSYLIKICKTDNDKLSWIALNKNHSFLVYFLLNI